MIDIAKYDFFISLHIPFRSEQANQEQLAVLLRRIVLLLKMCLPIKVVISAKAYKALIANSLYLRRRLSFAVFQKVEYTLIRSTSRSSTCTWDCCEVITMDIRHKRFQNANRSTLETKGLYHSFVLRNGITLEGAMDVEFLRNRLDSFQLPLDLNGTHVLDIGPWDGFFSFEMERRGATVTALDYVDLDTFRMLHKSLESKVNYIQKDIYELNEATDGLFDFVLLLGVLYHLKYPIVGLEKVCKVTLDTCIIDTFVIDAQNPLSNELPQAEYYERNELAGQLDNWWGPSISCVKAWARSAGFAEVELLSTTSSTACFAARRHWTKIPEQTAGSLILLAINHHQNRGRTFQSTKEEYIELWAQWEENETLGLEDLFPEVDGFGVPPLAVTHVADTIQVSMRVPFGLSSGKHSIRLRAAHFGWSQQKYFYLNLDDAEHSPGIVSVQDGVTWVLDCVDWSNGGWMTIWAKDLTAEADCGNVIVLVSDIPHYPQEVDISNGQINVKLRPIVTPGQHQVWIQHRGKISPLKLVTVVGSAPAIRGLELLN